MRRITLWLLGTITTLVLLFSYSTSTSSAGGAPPSAIAGPASGVSDPAGTSASSGSAGSSSSDGGSSSSSSPSTAKTVDGDTAMTQWGPVQVQITVEGEKITAANALQVPSGNHRDQEINSYAVPVLNSEVTSAQSAHIDMVSGATVTSDGYIQSLQSAIDRAAL